MGGCSSKDNAVAGDGDTAGTGTATGGPHGMSPGKGAVSPEKRIEKMVCKVGDMKDGEMREVDVGSGKALLVRELGEFSAIGHKCTHYGAPLVKGVLCNGRVRCPFHGACFNTKTGDIEDFPGLDSVPKFEVKIDGEKVIVSAKPKDLVSHKRVKKMVTGGVDEEKMVLIIGGGAASITCAETLRQEGFKGHITIATKEKHLPYDRPKLSKALNSTAESLALRSSDFFSIYDITMMLEKEATSVDTVINSVSFLDGTSISFDHLVIATGGKPRSLNIPGSDLSGVCMLRSPEDGNVIAEQTKNKNVVIIGTSFIGMEVAAYLSEKAASVTVVGRGAAPYLASLGERVGTALQKLSESKSVKFQLNNGVSEFSGEDGVLREVVLKDGVRLSADLCVLGVGVTPATGFLADSGLNMTSNGAVIVDKLMQSNKPNIYAVGDIAAFPLALAENQEVSIGHWQIAHSHGRIAALNIIGKRTEFESIPFFWTQLFGKSVRYAGYNDGYEDVIIIGDLDELKFVAYYIKNEVVVAVASMNSDPVVAQFAELLASGGELTKSDIQNDHTQWPSRL